MNPKPLFLSLVLAGGLVGMLALVLLWAGAIPSAALNPTATVRYVAPDGNCGGASPCYDNVQAAVDAAAVGDEIRVATGTYSGVNSRPDVTGTGDVTQTLYINKTVIIRGGYTTADWLTSNPAANPTTLDAQGEGRVLYAGGEISPTIEGLRLTGGNATLLEGGGGAAYVISATVTMSDNQAFGNTAADGGGFYFDFSNATLLSNQVYSNTSENDGGGICLFGGENITLAGNRIHDNTAANDGGGACLVAIIDATLTGNQIYNNKTGNNGGGFSFSAIFFSLALADNKVYGNAAANDGGGIYLGGIDTATLAGNQVYSNTCENDGGGVNLSGVYWITLASNLVYGNTSSNDGGGVYLGGAENATFTDNQVSDNTAANTGGGLFLASQKNDLTGNRIHNNEAGSDGGGLYIVGSDGDTLTTNRIYNNTTTGNGGGGYLQFTANALLTDNLIYGNAADADGGGIGLAVSENATFVNNAVLDNRITGSDGLGAGMYVASSPDLHLLHTTLARNGGSSAISLINYGSDQVTTTLTNTLLASHSVGISVTGASLVKVNGVLWYDMPDTVVSGPAATVTVQNQYQGDPAFAADGYHLTAGSAAIDKGVAAGVTSDIDGEARPFGAGYDLGADEYTDQGGPTPTPTTTATPTRTPTATVTLAPTSTPTPTATTTGEGKRTYLPLVLR